MKHYQAFPNPDPGPINVIVSDHVEFNKDGSIVATGNRPLEKRYDLRKHSPDGFQCGYGGSGPAQLALAILADAIGDDLALKHYQRFKDEVISNLSAEKGWILSIEVIQSWMKE